MVDSTIQAELLKQLDALPVASQARVLEFARSLSAKPKGKPGKEMLYLVGSISPEDCRLMQEAIEEGCEQVEPDEW